MAFNKSHSAAYAYIAYQTAYLKAHSFPKIYGRDHDELYAKHAEIDVLYQCLQEA